MPYGSKDYRSMLEHLESRLKAIESEYKALKTAISALRGLVNNQESESLPPHHERAAAARGSTLPDKVLNFLESHPGPKKISEVTLGLHGKSLASDSRERKAIRGALSRLAADGKIEKLERGQYQAAAK